MDDEDYHSLLRSQNRRTNVLGIGAYGVVRKAIFKGIHCAVKKFNFASTSSLWSSVPLREISSLMSIPPHENIISFYGCFTDDKNKINLIFPERKSNLFQYMNSLNNFIPEVLLIKWMRQLVSAVSHVHQNNFVHRDIKMENILVDDQNNVELADFGQTKFIPFQSFPFNLTGNVCSPCTRAPELIKVEKFKFYDEKVDAWSLGIVLLCLCTGKYVIHSENEESLNKSMEKYNTIEKIQVNCNRKVPTIVAETILDLLILDPDKRVRVIDVAKKLDVVPSIKKHIDLQIDESSECFSMNFILPEKNEQKVKLYHDRRIVGSFIVKSLLLLKCNLQTITQTLILWSNFSYRFINEDKDVNYKLIEQFHAAAACCNLICKIQEFNMIPSSTFCKLATMKSKSLYEWERIIMKKLKGKIIYNISFLETQKAALFCAFLVYSDLQINEFDETKLDHLKNLEIYTELTK